MEELLTGELVEDEQQVSARAKVLSKQLKGTQAMDSRSALDPTEATTTVLRTLRLPDISTLWPRLVPEVAVWASAKRAQLIAGRSDAVVVENGRVAAVLDWKGDVAPSTQDRASHLGQLSDYLGAIGADRGAVVYMTLGEVVWMHASVPAP